MRFQDKVAVVTGGASGIGAATVRLLVAEGAKVAVIDINESMGHALAEGLDEGRTHFIRCDVSDREALQAAIREAHQRFGRLDILFNNAGIGCFGETPDLDPEVWEKVIAIDLSAVFYACRVAIPLMREGGGGAIVNTASISGLAGDYGMTAYNASKGAVVNYTKSLAIDHARDNIRVNALCPGLIAHTGLTSMIPDQAVEQWSEGIPMGRAGSAREMATVVAFLLSDDASYMTGSIVVADGGVMAHTGQPNAMARRRNANAGR